MAFHIEWVRQFCLSLPGATEDIQWDNDLLFRVGRKIFCAVALEPAAAVKLCFKCTPEKFAELVEIEGVIPAPYMARNHWVALAEMDALRQPEIKELIGNSYRMIFEKLPKKLQAEIAGTSTTASRRHGGKPKQRKRSK